MSGLLDTRSPGDCRWDLVSLGEVMLRLDPGDERIATTRTFRVWEGGGEYNVARGLRRCFGLRTAVVTALADNQIGRLVEDLILQGGVDTSQIRWVPYDGIGRTVRNGLNFTERGFGIRGHTAVAQMRPGDVDWDEMFQRQGTRWFHCGGIFAALSSTTADVAEEAMSAAVKSGAIVSYDLNFRPSLWKGIGGANRAIEVNRRLAALVDVMFGNEEDFSAALGYDIGCLDSRFERLDTAAYAEMLHNVAADFPKLKMIATSLRTVAVGVHQRLGGNLLRRGQGGCRRYPRWSRDSRSCGRRRLLRLGHDFRLAVGVHRGRSPRVRCRTWRACHDDAGRYVDGDPCRCEGSCRWSGSASAEVMCPAHREVFRRQTDRGALESLLHSQGCCDQLYTGGRDGARAQYPV